MTEYRVGQIWACRRNKPESVFLILKLHVRKYKDGTEALRTKGVLVCGVDGMDTHLRDLDARSTEKMFPYLKFDPPTQDEWEGK